ncbi:MAG: hypothetical protein VB092_06120 [Oscillospiraceae bacterium]|nr:hypothetical protein [Oscillospiraceae bacterium]
MKKKLLALCAPIGLLLYAAYTVCDRFIVKIPDAVAYPVMIVSILFLLAGIVYNGYCFGKKKNPYDFR